MQFCEVKLGDYFSVCKYGNPCIFQKTSEKTADYIATRKGLLVWREIDWYDPLDAVTEFEPSDSVTIGHDVETYLYN